MRMSLSMIWILTGLAVGALAVAAAEPPPAPVPDPPTAEARQPEREVVHPGQSAEGIPPLLRSPDAGAETPALPSGLRAYVDPLTGELTTHPTPAQVRELTRTLAEHRFEQGMDFGAGWDTEGVYRFPLRAGGTGVSLGARFLTSTVVHVGPDGALHFECTHDPGEVQEQPGTTRKPTPGTALK